MINITWLKEINLDFDSEPQFADITFTCAGVQIIHNQIVKAIPPEESTVCAGGNLNYRCNDYLTSHCKMNPF